MKGDVTPRKINMEPKNHPIENENHLNQTIISQVQNVNLPGCFFYISEPRFFFKAGTQVVSHPRLFGTPGLGVSICWPCGYQRQGGLGGGWKGEDQKSRKVEQGGPRMQLQMEL